MNTGTKRFLLWAPRILGILFAVLVTMFAFDVFGQGYGLWRTIAAFLVHLIPTYIVIIALIVAWRWEWVGAVVFFALAVFSVVWSRGRFGFVAYLRISGHMVLIGVLFLLSWIYRAQLRKQ